MVRRDNYCKAMTLKPTIFWSFWEKGFRYGPRRISYDHAIHRLVHGFKITIDAEICYTFNGESWTLGQQNISVSDFKEILLNLDSNEKSTSPQGLPFQSSNLVPTCSLRQGLSDKSPAPIHAKSLFSWKFDDTPSKETEPYGVLILALQVTGAGISLIWVREEVLHQDYKGLFT